MEKHYDIKWLRQKYESGENLKYIFFWGHTPEYKEEVGKYCFSQWFKCPFIVNNITYKTAEHWMMAHKALLFNDKNAFDKIIQCEKPGEAKEIGREVLGYNEQIWSDKKFDIVKLGNIHKFNQNPKLADFLLKTQNRILVEASPIDTIWGIGLSPDSNDIENIYAWRGENLLGFALMEARDFLKNFGHFKQPDKSLQIQLDKIYKH
ncbi:NADAR family protein [Pedobacter boryungensis]|uniref:NADAR family protein n=1 Tax=Pedobacter boryungensis TaxID=869962 RepID=A0ABX2DGL5_9SPHI|nr:NADAR family protein [Pedobacter boryungensis]NQX32451.1 NADAR family protein [Pedobacter boryungensis]